MFNLKECSSKTMGVATVIMAITGCTEKQPQLPVQIPIQAPAPNFAPPGYPSLTPDPNSTPIPKPFQTQFCASVASPTPNQTVREFLKSAINAANFPDLPQWTEYNARGEITVYKYDPDTQITLNDRPSLSNVSAQATVAPNTTTCIGIR